MKNRLFSSFALSLFAVAGWRCQNESPAQTAVLPAAFQANQPAVDSVPVSGTDAAYLLGKFAPVAHPDFVPVGKPYTDKPGMTLRKETFEAFKRMFEAAEKEGVVLKIISATRTFEQQKKIWERKWNRFAKEAPAAKDRALKILEYSAMPGSSRHHWGTDLDLNDLNNASFEKGGRHEKVYAWLAAHAGKYGFCQPYTAGRPTGYREEKWHWSYTPLSKTLLEQYQNQLSEADIRDFKGSDTASEIGIVKNYVLGISGDCR